MLKSEGWCGPTRLTFVLEFSILWDSELEMMLIRILKVNKGGTDVPKFRATTAASLREQILGDCFSFLRDIGRAEGGSFVSDI